jgi:hypothetical protein
MKNYFKTKEELFQMYRSMEKPTDISDLDWILKLIKMKNGRDFVEEELRLLCIRK